MSAFGAGLGGRRASRWAGCEGYYVPGLADAELIRAVCEGVALPVNVMKSPLVPDIATLSACGVARVSHGPFPYREAMARLTAEAAAE